jgi:alanine racemase
MATSTAPRRWAWAEIDLDAIEHNIATMRDLVAPSGVWAVVKADGYGHGSIRVANAALRAGAEGLGVALVQEGVELRRAGISAPILVLSEQPPEQLAAMLANDLSPTVYSTAAIEALVAAGADDVGVHLKIDSGMQRVGASPADAVGLVEQIVAHAPALRLHGVFTHLAMADEPTSTASREQLERFDRALDAIHAAGHTPSVVHAANSAGALAVADARRSFVRVGIATYGISPGPGVDHLTDDLRPALALKARVSYVKRVEAGTRVSYGWRHEFAEPTTVATLPLGYADGVARRMGTLPDRPGADVLVAGRRCPIVGVVTMDQFVVDVGDLPVAVGDEAVLIGRQGSEQITAEEWADRLGSIGYEVVCAISARIPRVEVGGTSGREPHGADGRMVVHPDEAP